MKRLDKKGRVSVPSSFRDVLSRGNFRGIVGFRSFKFAAIECFSMERMETLSQDLESLDLFSQDQDHFASSIFADAEQLGFDTEGRIALPTLWKEHTGCMEEIAFVGRGSTFQIWNPQGFAEHQAQARETLRQQQGSLKRPVDKN